MIAIRKQGVAIFVDRLSGQWIVRDPEGKFWLVPSGENAWDNRQPFHADQDMDLEPVPGHYKYLLDLPF